MILPREFYQQPSLTVAQNLVGCMLCRAGPDGRLIRARIAEVELYTAAERGCHAYGNKKTPRNDAMFLAGGHAYVYLCYGLHEMFNIVLGDAGMAAAVLVRAVEMPGGNGPGRLTRQLGITRGLNKHDLTQGTELWVESRNGPAPIITTGVRIGIDFAGEDAFLPWRFAITDSPFLSRPI